MLSWAPRDDVLFQTTSSSPTHISNGASWYFSEKTYPASWGFARADDRITRGECDHNDENGQYRLCWHTTYSPGGWRCGSNTALDRNRGWERVIFQRGIFSNLK